MREAGSCARPAVVWASACWAIHPSITHHLPSKVAIQGLSLDESVLLPFFSSSTTAALVIPRIIYSVPYTQLRYCDSIHNG